MSLVQTWVNAARAGQEIVVSSADARRDWTFVADLAPALARIFDGQALARPIHLCTPIAMTDRDVANAIAARFAGAVVKSGEAMPAKAPMVPSNLAQLQGFAWTSLDAGLDTLCHTGVAA